MDLPTPEQSAALTDEELTALNAEIAARQSAGGGRRTGAR
jgi:hypothetical protein